MERANWGSWLRGRDYYGEACVNAGRADTCGGSALLSSRDGGEQNLQRYSDAVVFFVVSRLSSFFLFLPFPPPREMNFLRCARFQRHMERFRISRIIIFARWTRLGDGMGYLRIKGQIELEWCFLFLVVKNNVGFVYICSIVLIVRVDIQIQ